MKCKSCQKVLELDESKHLGLCYGCRKPPWDRSSILQGSKFDPFGAVDDLRSALRSSDLLTEDIDASLATIINLLKQKK
jgi:hypothetical protein